MCGRFVVAGSSSDLVALFDVDLASDALPAASWNIAPTDPISIVLDAIPQGEGASTEPVRRLEAARWGLVPSWAKDLKLAATAFNARIETAASKPHFATAVKKRRALVPATGYYEWHTVDGVKTPYFLHLPGDELLVFAGLYEWWRNPAADGSADRWMLSATILTRNATGELAAIHDRMPVFLDPEMMDEWLDPYSEGTQDLLDEVAVHGADQADRVRFYEVGHAVGNVRNDGPELAEPLSA